MTQLPDFLTYYVTGKFLWKMSSLKICDKKMCDIISGGNCIYKDTIFMHRNYSIVLFS